MTGDWVFGAIAALTLLHGLALLYVYRRGTAASGAGAVDAEAYVSEDGIECPNCGEHNERGYQFCRQCVSELPARMSFLGESSAPATRRTL
jgi:hypothetical protein